MGERGDWTHHFSPDFTGTADSVGIAIMCLPGMLVLPAHGMLGEQRRQEQGGRIPHIQSNHLSVTLICSTVRCTLGRSGDRGHTVLRPVDCSTERI